MFCSESGPPDILTVKSAASGSGFNGVNVIGTVKDPPAGIDAGRDTEGAPTEKSELSELMPVTVTADVQLMVRVWVVEEPTGVVGKEVGVTDNGWGTGAPNPKICPLMFPT